MSNGNDGRSMAGNWTAAVIISAFGILMVFVWDRINVGSQLQDASTKIIALQQQIDRLAGIRDTQIKDEGTVIQNTHDIDELKRRLDARGK